MALPKQDLTTSAQAWVPDPHFVSIGQSDGRIEDYLRSVFDTFSNLEGGAEVADLSDLEDVSDAILNRRSSRAPRDRSLIANASVYTTIRPSVVSATNDVGVSHEVAVTASMKELGS